MSNIEKWVATVTYSKNAYTIGSDNNVYVSTQDANLANDPVIPPSSGLFPWLLLGSEIAVFEWNDVTHFALDGYTRGSDGKLYKSLIADNINHDPISSTTEWSEVPVGSNKNDFIIPEFGEDAINKGDGAGRPSMASFGSLPSSEGNVGNIVYTSDPRKLVMRPAWKDGGWQGATTDLKGDKKAVAIQDMNSFARATVSGLRNATNASLLPWHPNRVYMKGDSCTGAIGLPYFSLIDNNVGNLPPATASDANWQRGATGSSSLPDQTGNAGKFLTTDGTDASWGGVAIPPLDNGKYLTNDGTDLLWGTPSGSGGGTNPITVNPLTGTRSFSIERSLATQIGNFIMLNITGLFETGATGGPAIPQVGDKICELSGFTGTSTQISFHVMTNTNTGTQAGVARFNGGGSIHQLEVFAISSVATANISISTVIGLF